MKNVKQITIFEMIVYKTELIAIIQQLKPLTTTDIYILIDNSKLLLQFIALQLFSALNCFICVFAV